MPADITEHQMRTLASDIASMRVKVQAYANDDLRVLDRMLENAFTEALLQAQIINRINRVKGD